MLSLCSVEAQTLQNLFPPFPRGWGQVSHPEPGLSRGEETADRESLSVLAEPRSQSCQPILGTGSSWTSPAVCVWGGEGGVFVPQLPRETKFYIGCSLQCPDSDPRTSPNNRPGRTKLPLAAGCQAGRVRQLTGQPARPGSQTCHPLSLSPCISFASAMT